MEMVTVDLREWTEVSIKPLYSYKVSIRSELSTHTVLLTCYSTNQSTSQGGEIDSALSGGGAKHCGHVCSLPCSTVWSVFPGGDGVTFIRLSGTISKVNQYFKWFHYWTKRYLGDLNDGCICLEHGLMCVSGILHCSCCIKAQGLSPLTSVLSLKNKNHCPMYQLASAE